MAVKLPRYGCVTRLLFDLVRYRTGASTRELIDALGIQHRPGVMYVNSCLNYMARDGLVENRVRAKRTMGHWYVTTAGERAAVEVSKRHGKHRSME